MRFFLNKNLPDYQDKIIDGLDEFIEEVKNKFSK